MREHPYTRGLLNCMPKIGEDRHPLPVLDRKPEWALVTPALAIDGLRVVYDGYHALKGVSLEVAQGESFGLVGESGSGKSTLLRAIAGLAPVSGGEITVNGEKLGARRDKAFYRKVQMVFQDPYGSLHPRQTVDRLLLEPLAIHGFADIEPRILRALDEVGLGLRLPLPLFAPAFRRPAPARGDRPRADPGTVDPAARRADLGARRLGAGGSAQPAGTGAPRRAASPS